jgi:hypothetical protein
MSLWPLSFCPRAKNLEPHEPAPSEEGKSFADPRGVQAMVQRDDGAALRYFAKQIRSVWS